MADKEDVSLTFHTSDTMNIKVITRHGPSNYGSLLQSIATIKTLESLGHQCEIIDYQRPDERGLKGVLTQLRCKAGYGNPIKKIAYVAIRYPIEKYAQDKFDHMRKKYLKMTKRYTTQEELKQLNADAFMTGSDQVWGPMMNGKYDSTYFLQFAKDGVPRLSYAASFGKTKFDGTIVAEYKNMLATYNRITVREKSAVDLIQKWGLKNCIGQVLDPTLLLNKEQWKALLIDSATDAKYAGRNYILVYQIHNDPKLSEYAKHISAHLGVELLRVNPMLHQKIRGGKFICCPDVGEFLAIIEHAKCVITDSFHGTCFALNFGKQLIEILPNNATGTRNLSILELTGLSGRILRDFSDYSLIDKTIDYHRVWNILEQERIKSINKMRELLG